MKANTVISCLICWLLALFILNGDCYLYLGRTGIIIAFIAYVALLGYTLVSLLKEDSVQISLGLYKWQNKHK